MTGQVELILLNSTRFGENRLVLHTLSREYGRRGFLVTVGKKTPMALFLPLNILEGDVTENPKSSLWTLRNPVSAHPLLGIRNNLYKNTMTLFMSEVLFRTLRDGANEEGLYDWCLRSIHTLEEMPSDYSNFPIRFLLELSVALGFSPSFDDIAPFAQTHLPVLERFLGASFGESMLIPLTGADRNAIAEDLLRYLEFHTESSINVRSLKVLRELYR